MNKDDQNEVIDLGSIIDETKGPAGVPADTFGGLVIKAGLSED